MCASDVSDRLLVVNSQSTLAVLAVMAVGLLYQVFMQAVTGEEEEMAG